MEIDIAVMWHAALAVDIIVMVTASTTPIFSRLLPAFIYRADGYHSAAADLIGDRGSHAIFISMLCLRRFTR